MEPQLVDFYNEMPSGINVIEKMNDELSELQKNYTDLTIKYNNLKTFGPEWQRILAPIYHILPGKLKKLSLPFYIGETIVTARKPI